MAPFEPTVQQSLSSLQHTALRIAWRHLGCDEDVDALTNELLSEHFPIFQQHRNHLNPKYRQLLRSGLWEQYESLCDMEGWFASEHLDVFESHFVGPVRFRDILGCRQSYPGRFFDRSAIGSELCNAAFAEVRRSLQQLSAQNLIRVVGNLGFVLTDLGISMSRSLFPDIQPLRSGNPHQKADELSIRRIIHERRRKTLESTS